MIDSGPISAGGTRPRRSPAGERLERARFQEGSMNTLRLFVPLVGFLVVGGSTPGVCGPGGDDPPARNSPEQRFEALLAAAQEDPSKADWKALRHAFAQTSMYQPYNPGWRREFASASRALRDGKLKEAEAALLKLLERERLMRIDGHAMAVALYEKVGDTQKARMHRAFLEGLSSALFVPGHGTSVEKPIEVLFLEEEYMVLGSLGLEMTQQALTEHKGARLDVLSTKSKNGQAGQSLYFNIDLPWNSLQREMQKALGGAKEPGGRK
jgi:hypothetical protein